MPSYIAPAVYIEERDYSEYVAALATTQCAMVGVATKGPLNTPTLITSVENFVNTFGPPSNIGYGPYAAIGYLRRGSQLWYCRVAKQYEDETTITALGTPTNGSYNSFSAATGHSITIGDYIQIQEAGKPTLQGVRVTDVDVNLITISGWFSTGYTTAAVVNISHAYDAVAQAETFAVSRASGTVTPLVHIVAKDPGSWANFGSSKGIELRIEDGGNFAAIDPTTGFPATGAAVALRGVQPSNPSVDDLAGLFALTSDTVHSGSMVGVNSVSRVFSVTAVTAIAGKTALTIPGIAAAAMISSAQSVEVHAIDGYNGVHTVFSVATNSDGNTVVQLSDTTAPESPLTTNGTIENLSDTVKQALVFRCSAANSTGSTWTTVGVLTKRLRVLYQGHQVEIFDNLIGYDVTSPNYWDTAVTSNYIAVTYGGSGQQPINSYSASSYPNNPRYLMGLTLGVFESNDPTSPTVVIPVASGQDGDAPSASDYIGITNDFGSTGIQHFRRVEAYDVSLLCVPGISDAAVINEILSVLSARNDCFGVIDPPLGLTVQRVVDWHNGQGDWSGLHDAFVSNAAGLYYPWIKQYDPYTKNNVWLPPSASVCGVIAYSDSQSTVWTAPAGISRGKVPNALAVERLLTQGDVEYMYGPGNGNAVNPIMSYSKDGIVVDGQRTMQRYASSLDRINVRRMIFFLEKSLATIVRRLRFEQNDELLWAQARGLALPTLSNLRGSRAIEWFSLVCDATNNTAELRNQDTVRLDINVIAEKSAEILIIGVNLFPSGANVTELTQLSGTSTTG